MVSATSATLGGSRAEVGSSRSRACGSPSRARAIVTRCFSPPDKVAASRSSSPGSRPTSARADANRPGEKSPEPPGGRTRRLPRTEPSKSTGVCMTRAARRRSSRGSSERMSRPPNRRRRAVGSTRRLRHRRSVDLPEPDGPTRTRASPRSTPTDTSLRIETGAWFGPPAWASERCSISKSGSRSEGGAATAPASVTLVLPGGRRGYAGDDTRRDDEGRGDAAQPEPSFGVRLGQGVAQGRAEGAGQDVRGPEDRALRDRGDEVRRRDEAEQAGEDQRAALESEARARRHEVAERGAERVRDQDRHPVEDLVRPRGDVVELDPPRGAAPDYQGGQAPAKHRMREDAT